MKDKSIWLFWQTYYVGNRTFNTKARFHVELNTWISIRNIKIYIAPYGKKKHWLVKLSYTCDVKSGRTVDENDVELLVL